MPIKIKFRLLILLLGVFSFFSCSANKHQKSIQNNNSKESSSGNNILKSFEEAILNYVS